MKIVFPPKEPICWSAPSPETKAEQRERLLAGLRRGNKLDGVSARELDELQKILAKEKI